MVRTSLACNVHTIGVHGKTPINVLLLSVVILFYLFLFLVVKVQCEAVCAYSYAQPFRFAPLDIVAQYLFAFASF